MTESIITPKARVSFPNVFTPNAMNPGDTPKYSISLLFNKGEDLSKLKALIKSAVQEKWGDKPPKGLRNPILDQGDREYDGYEEGAFFIRASSKRQPGLINQRKERIIDEEEFYPGCYCVAQINAYAYDMAGNRGVAFGLNNIMKVAEGEPLGGRSKPEDAFASVEIEEAEDTDALFD